MLGDLPSDPYDYEFNELIQTIWEGTVTSNWVEIQIVDGANPKLASTGAAAGLRELNSQ